MSVSSLPSSILYITRENALNSPSFFQLPSNFPPFFLPPNANLISSSIIFFITNRSLSAFSHLGFPPIALTFNLHVSTDHFISGIFTFLLTLILFLGKIVVVIVGGQVAGWEFLF